MFKRLGFKSIRKLGSGAFGQVVEIEYQGRLCALKYGDHHSILDEAKILEVIGKHPNIVQALASGVDQDPDTEETTWWMVMEKFDESLVSSFQHERLKPEHLKTMFRHVLEALVYIQGKGFTHGDCHMGNIGVKWDTLTQPRFILCDFGLANSYREEDGTLLSLPNVRDDFDRFFKVVTRYLPYPDSVPRALEEKILVMTIRATTKYRPGVLLYLLQLASENVINRAIGTAVEENQVESLRLVLTFKARQTGQTLASVCRELLERKEKMPTGTFLNCSLDPFMAMFEWAGYVDNPELKRVVSRENSWFIRDQVKGPMPELLQRILSI